MAAEPQAPNSKESPSASGMALDLRKIYFNAVLGGIGGLVGWLVMSAVEALPGVDINVYVMDMMKGLVIGICVGLCIGSSDGLIVSRSLQRWLWGALVGAGLGALEACWDFLWASGFSA